MIVDYDKQTFYAGQNLQKVISEKILSNYRKRSELYLNDRDAMGLLRQHFDFNKTTSNNGIQKMDNDNADEVINELAFYEISNIVL